MNRELELKTRNAIVFGGTGRYMWVNVKGINIMVRGLSLDVVGNADNLSQVLN